MFCIVSGVVDKVFLNNSSATLIEKNDIKAV